MPAWPLAVLVAALLAAAVQAQEGVAPPAPAADTPDATIPSDTDGTSDTPAQPDTASGSEPSTPASGIISGNPAATNVSPGTGDLGRLLRVDPCGIRVGGVWVMDQNCNLSGGLLPGDWAEAQVSILDVTFDLEKLAGWKGSRAGIEFLNRSGAPANRLTGDLLGYDGLDCVPPFSRSELYELWYLQTLFNKRLSIRLGKQIPTYDFANIADVTPLISRSIFVMPTMLPEPGYPDSATGVNVKVAPVDWWYAQFGWYDGRFGVDRTPTGMLGPQFSGEYFTIGETGLIYKLGAQRLPGKIGVGGWRQTGRLERFDGGFTEGAAGFYLFGKQLLWREQSGDESQGVKGYLQYGTTNPDTQWFSQYFGCGLTWTGFLPGRDRDSIAMGLFYGRLTDAPDASFFGQPPGAVPSGETLLQWTYQGVVTRNFFVQPTLSYIINPGSNASLKNALPLTLRIGLVF